MIGKPDESNPVTLGLIKYGGREPDASEEVVADDDDDDDMGIVLEDKERAVDRADAEWGGSCPLPGAEGNMVCRSASVCPGA